MLDNLIDRYSEIRTNSKDMNDKGFAISVTNRELTTIITALKIYRNIDLVFDEEIEIKMNRKKLDS